MNYYIKGDKERAEEIKAAFEKKGVGLPIRRSCADDGLIYFLLDGKVFSITIKAIELFKKNPDYKKLELPIEPKFKFKVGDWIVQNDNGTVSQITKVINSTDEYGEYRAYEHTNGYFHTFFEKEFHLWTIQDAQDGDVLYSLDSKQPFIYKVRPQFSQARGYCCINKFGDFAVWNTNKCIICTDKYIPATKEQRDRLFQKMKEAGYEWDADKKELLKIKHYAIANFRPFDKVLGRDYDEGVWICDLYSYYYKGDNKMGVDNAFVCVGDSHLQCIPYEDNEHLLGTTGMPSEEYINW